MLKDDMTVTPTWSSRMAPPLHHADHLAGINRVGGGDVALGRRLPGAGRFFRATPDWEL